MLVLLLFVCGGFTVVCMWWFYWCLYVSVLLLFVCVGYTVVCMCRFYCCLYVVVLLLFVCVGFTVVLSGSMRVPCCVSVVACGHRRGDEHEPGHVGGEDRMYAADRDVTHTYVTLDFIVSCATFLSSLSYSILNLVCFVSSPEHEVLK